MIKQLPQRCRGPRSPGLLPVDAVQGVGQEEEEGHPQPGPAGDLLLLQVRGAREQGGRGEVVVVQRQQPKVSKATDETDESEEVGGHPQRA